MIISSSVATTDALTALPARVMQGPWAALARAVSRDTPRQAAPSQTCWLTCAACSPTLPVNTRGTEPAQRRRQRAELAPDPVDEQVDRFLCRRRLAVQQGLHVAADV